MVYISSQANSIIQKEATVSGAINAVINGIIAWFMFQGKATVPLTVDTISAHEKTVFSNGVMTAFMLSLILGTIAYFNFKKKAKSLQLAHNDQLLERPFLYFGVRVILFYSLFAFGTMAIVALFIQKFLGSILVAPFIAAACLGIIAGLAAWFINAAVMREMLRPE